GGTRPLSFYELKKQLGNDVDILQELVAEEIILEQKVEINGPSSDTPLDTVTLYFNKIKKELPKDYLSTLTLKRKFPAEESNLQTDPISVDINSQIQSLRSRLCELNNIELDLKKQLQKFGHTKDIGQSLPTTARI
ncbi:9722_t:CDS:2, partial [Funneliformis geosporum]